MRLLCVWIAALVSVAVPGASCVPSPEDPLDFGMLCRPATDDCPAFITLERDVRGRNQLDYIVRNVGDSTAVVEVVALVPSAVFDEETMEIDPVDLVARQEHQPIAPGDVADHRFTAQQLGVREAFQLAIRCTNCDVELEWVYASVPRECFAADDCPANWLCDENLGRCVECLVSADCNDDQRCNAETGRCAPPDTTAGCTTTAKPPSWLWPLVLVVLLVGLRRRRAQRIAAVALAAALTFAAPPAQASPPRASVSVGAGARVFTGMLGPLTKRGVGLSVQQELRWRHIGAALSLGTSYFLTLQKPPPFSRSFQTYGVTLGPRVYVPTRYFELAGGADYRRLGTANNSLIRHTGIRTSFDAVGGLGGVRLRWSGLEIRVEGGAHYLLQLQSTMISADLAVGFTNTK